MSNEKITKLEEQIEAVKKELMRFGAMRPGSLSKQYRDRRNQTGGYYQLSYTHKMQSRTEYVRAEHVARLQAEVAEFKRWRELIEQWADLSLELSRQRIAELKKSR